MMGCLVRYQTPDVLYREERAILQSSRSKRMNMATIDIKDSTAVGRHLYKCKLKAHHEKGRSRTETAEYRRHTAVQYAEHT
ncbi:hypothetical protein TNCV_1948171 [Trichonephila clavipes]|nr:hypothetical protein TNCV_1948171 [Trichonephila clavipes]